MQVAGKNTASLSLFPLAAPFWVSAPRNLILAPNETGILTCRVNGEPKPDIQWFVNGIPLESELTKTILYRANQLALLRWEMSWQFQ